MKFAIYFHLPIRLITFPIFAGTSLQRLSYMSSGDDLANDIKLTDETNHLQWKNKISKNGFKKMFV